MLSEAQLVPLGRAPPISPQGGGNGRRLRGKGGEGKQMGVAPARAHNSPSPADQPRAFPVPTPKVALSYFGIASQGPPPIIGAFLHLNRGIICAPHLKYFYRVFQNPVSYTLDRNARNVFCPSYFSGQNRRGQKIVNCTLTELHLKTRNNCGRKTL